MNQDGQLSALMGDIYEAAFDASLWSAVLEKAAGYVGGQAAGLLSKDSVSKVGAAYYHFGVDDDYIRLYNETHSKLDPQGPLLFSTVGEIMTLSDDVPEAELHESRFYREWLRPQSWVDAANVVLDKSMTSFAILSFVRTGANGPVDDDMLTRMRLVVPHIRRAVLVGKVIDQKTAEAATVADALDGISAGMFLVDAGGRIVHANAAAHGIVASGDFLRESGGRLVAQDRDADRALKGMFAAAGKGDIATGLGGSALPLAGRDDEPHVAHVLPLTSGARRSAGASDAAVAALFVHKAAIEIRSPPETIARHYKLTPTELRVLLAIVDVGGVPDVADALGVAQTTVKWHLGRLYQKTGSARQADLVKLVASFSNPLLN